MHSLYISIFIFIIEISNTTKRFEFFQMLCLNVLQFSFSPPPVFQFQIDFSFSPTNQYITSINLRANHTKKETSTAVNDIKLNLHRKKQTIYGGEKECNEFHLIFSLHQIRLVLFPKNNSFFFFK